jgi:hypothetical protein
MMVGTPGRLAATVRRVALVALWLWGTGAHAGAVPLLAQGAAGLVAPPLNEAAKPVKPAAPEGGGGEAAAEPAADEAAPQVQLSLQAHLMKYGPGYVLMVLLVGLGTSIACAPRPGTLGQADAGKDKSKGPGRK